MRYNKRAGFRSKYRTPSTFRYRKSVQVTKSKIKKK